MEKNRIAVISYHTCPLASREGKETGGMNVYVFELSRQLAKLGYVVDVFTRNQDSQHNPIVTVENGFRVVHINAGPQSTIPKKELMPFIPQFTRNLLRFVEENKLKYDLLHAHYYMSGVVALEIRRRKPGLPIVMTFHTLALMKNLVARDESERESTQRIEIEFELVKKVNRIITPSENDFSYLVSLYGTREEKITVIPPGVNTDIFKPINRKIARDYIGANFRHKIILFVGRIEPLKGIDELMYSLKILKTKHPHLTVCLWIVGGDISQKFSNWPRQLKKLEQLRRELRIASFVKFVGQKPQQALPYYYNAADVVVMPSHYESFGIAALEAMACGVPVITTNVTGISTLFDKKHEPLITTVNNPILLSDQISRIITDNKLHRELSDSVYMKVQDLDWKNVASQIISLYRHTF